MIANGSFDPETIKVMTTAYESALADLGLIDRNDPITELVANTILTIASTGERDPELIKQRALNVLGVRKTDAA